MSFDNKSKLLAFVVVSAVLLSMAMPAALAEGTTKVTTPDITVITAMSGAKVGGASVYVDNSLAGKTDSKGNLTLGQAPAAGNHTILVTAKGLKNATVSTDFSKKPVVVTADPLKGKNVTIHVASSANKEGIKGVSVYNGNYLIGTTNAAGDLTFGNFPAGIYLVKLQKEGFKSSTTLLIVLSDNKKHNYMLSASA